MKAARKDNRGTKRRCQNVECGLPFYDLNRTEIVCPECSVAYVAPTLQERSPTRGRPPRYFSRPALPVIAAPDAEAEAVPEALEIAAPAVEPADEIILEVEEDDEEVLPVATDPEAPPED